MTTAAMHGAGLAGLLATLHAPDTDPAARMFDAGLLHQLALQPVEAASLQAAALASSALYRVRRDSQDRPVLRLLAVVSPGDLMANTPLDFITRHLDIQLDLLFMTPGADLPDIVPDHDLMIFASSEPGPAMLARMQRLYRSWPRPVVNDPSLLPLLARDRLSALLSGRPGLCSPAAVRVDQATLQGVASGTMAWPDLFPGLGYPVLVRPAASHAGQGLEKIGNRQDLVRYLAQQGGVGSVGDFYVTAFVDYSGPDGLFRKYRVAFIDGQAHLCHMAVSDHWMVHYLNAGMTESPAKRAEEAASMAGFDEGFAARHTTTFALLNNVLPFDYYTIDCAELPDGRLLVFEADTAAIIHQMDAAELFPYKHTQMTRVFSAFASMLQTRLLEG